MSDGKPLSNVPELSNSVAEIMSVMTPNSQILLTGMVSYMRCLLCD